MIRLVLAPGPQRGREVRRWVSEASNFSDRKIYEVVRTMVDQGELITGAWALPAKNRTTRLGRSLKARLPKELPPSKEELPEVIEQEWRELMGDDQ